MLSQQDQEMLRNVPDPLFAGGSHFCGRDYPAKSDHEQGGRSRSRVSAKWPTRLLFTVYFTYTSKEQTYFEKHVASLVSLLLSTQLDKGYQKMDPSPPFPNI